jgi:hypothetical protein
MHKGHFAQGRITGTGAVINVELGFIPETVHIRNVTSRDELFWDEGMTNGHGFKRVAAGTGTAITSNGISPYVGALGTNARGFTIGTDADINVSAEILHYTAISSDA